MDDLQRKKEDINKAVGNKHEGRKMPTLLNSMNLGVDLGTVLTSAATGRPQEVHRLPRQ